METIYNLNGLAISTRHAFEAVLDRIELKKGMINYANEALASNELENWERKEYSQVVEDAEKELQEAKAHLKYLLSQFPEVTKP